MSNRSKNTGEYIYSDNLYNSIVSEGIIVPLTEQQKNEHKINKWVKPEYTPTSTHKLNSGKVSRQGNGYGNMTDAQKAHFLDTLRAGCGAAVACDKCGVSWDVYIRSMKADPRFASEVRFANKLAMGKLEEDITIAGKLSDSVTEKIAVRKMFLEIQSRSDSRHHNKRKLDIEQQKIDLLRDASKEAKGLVDKFEYGDMSLEDAESFTALYRKAGEGHMLTDQETSAFLGYIHRLSSYAKANKKPSLNALMNDGISHDEDE